MGKFIIKHIDNRRPQINVSNNTSEPKEVKKEESVVKAENKKKNINEVMTTSEKIAMAQEVLGETNAPSFKRVKKDKGLIERTESSKTILTEDNKELLND